MGALCAEFKISFFPAARTTVPIPIIRSGEQRLKKRNSSGERYARTRVVKKLKVHLAGLEKKASPKENKVRKTANINKLEVYKNLIIKKAERAQI